MCCGVAGAADEAKTVGLVNHVVGAGKTHAEAIEIAESIAQNGPIAVRQAKKAIAWGQRLILKPE